MQTFSAISDVVVLLGLGVYAVVVWRIYRNTRIVRRNQRKLFEKLGIVSRTLDYLSDKIHETTTEAE
jgi:hypothetical protein